MGGNAGAILVSRPNLMAASVQKDELADHKANADHMIGQLLCQGNGCNSSPLSFHPWKGRTDNTLISCKTTLLLEHVLWKIIILPSNYQKYGPDMLRNIPKAFVDVKGHDKKHSFLY